jgi:hypothetical protein
MGPIEYFICFLVTAFITYILHYISNHPKKDEPRVIINKNLLPGVIVGFALFIYFKYRNTDVFNSEPMMEGNFFD